LMHRDRREILGRTAAGASASARRSRSGGRDHPPLRREAADAAPCGPRACSMSCARSGESADARLPRSGFTALLPMSCADRRRQTSREDSMAKKRSGGGVYRVVDVVGVSETSWEDAARRAVETAAASLRDLRIAEVTKMDIKVDDGKVSAFRTRVALSFKYEPH